MLYLILLLTFYSCKNEKKKSVHSNHTTEQYQLDIIGKDNFKLPKDTTPENLSIEECIHISKNQAPKTAKKKVFRKK